MCVLTSGNGISAKAEMSHDDSPSNVSYDSFFRHGTA